MEIASLKQGSKWTLAMVLLLVAFAFGCGDDIGAECSQHADCDERCVTGGDFPGGMCTLSCDGDPDCPSGTSCVAEEDGICLLQCEADRDCPGGYECDDVRRRGSGGEAQVCIGA